MNLDIGAAGVKPNPESRSVAAVARKGPAGGEDGPESGASPFQSLLQALDPAVAIDAAGVPAAPQSPPVAESGAATPADAQAVVSQGDPPALADPAAVVAQMAGPPLAGASAAPLVSAQGAGSAGRAGVRPGTVGVGAKGDPTQRENTLSAADDGLDTSANGTKSALDLAAGSGTGQTAARGGSHALGQALEAHANARQALMQAAGDHRAGAQLRAPELPNASAPPAAVSAALGASMFESGAVVFRGGLTPARPGERAPARAFATGAAASMAGPWADLGLTGVSNAASPAFAVNAATALPELALADKLNYWVGRGVQHAVLKLDAFGGGSVDVSISVQGNEATVEFRTDQSEARRLLHEAMPQLKEMLKGQGLELAGGFVGTSAQQDRGGQNHGAQQSGMARSLSLRGQETDPARAPARSATHGRTVDLFV